MRTLYRTLRSTDRQPENDEDSVAEVIGTVLADRQAA